MALYTVSTGSTINAADINQLVNFLQPPAGNQVSGSYYLPFFVTASGQFVGCYVALAQRGATGVSVTLSATSTPSALNSGVTAHLAADGFEIYWQSNASSLNASPSGTWTVQY